MNEKYQHIDPVWVIFFLVILTITLLQLSACVHPPYMPADMIPGDTMPADTVPNDTIPGDTMVFHPCDPDTVYFEKELLPILVSNCAMSGCHDAQSAQDGVILDSYENVFNTSDLKPGDPNSSDLYEVLIDDDPGDRMPPLPADPLPQATIDKIFIWIEQGAQNLHCDMDSSACDTSSVSYAAVISPLMETHCKGCHSGNSPGGGVLLDNHTNVAAAGNNGRLYGSIAHLNGFSPMPKNEAKLDQCAIDQVQAWINQGTLDN
jgi:mono/diheme cytochrome c family protein